MFYVLGASPPPPPVQRVLLLAHPRGQHGVGNIFNQDPATNTVQSFLEDGSYGMTLRLGDLAPGERNTVNWFYGAALFPTRAASPLP